MSLFAIERSFGGRRDALFALKRFGREASMDVQWQRSFFVRGQNRSLCIWQSPSVDALTGYAAASLPVHRVREVVEIAPGACGLEEPRRGSGQLYCVLRRFAAPLTRMELHAGALRSVRCASAFPGLEWIRSYWNESDNVSFCFYQALRQADLRAHSMLLAAPCDEVWKVTEIS